MSIIASIKMRGCDALVKKLCKD